MALRLARQAWFPQTSVCHDICSVHTFIIRHWLYQNLTRSQWNCSKPWLDGDWCCNYSSFGRNSDTLRARNCKTNPDKLFLTRSLYCLPKLYPIIFKCKLLIRKCYHYIRNRLNRTSLSHVLCLLYNSRFHSLEDIYFFTEYSRFQCCSIQFLIYLWPMVASLCFSSGGHNLWDLCCLRHSTYSLR